MKGYLNNKQIRYILFHLGQHLDLHNGIQEKFVFIPDTNESTGFADSIVFPLSSSEINTGEIMSVDDIPILFPVSTERTFYRMEGSSLVFNHDLLKSAFYLLSGYQERKVPSIDKLGRFDFGNSIQHKLGFTSKPIVNYYFKIISDGILEYCRLHNINIKERHEPGSFFFTLTHDVDRIRYYTINTFVYQIKQFAGLAGRNKPAGFYLKESLSTLAGILLKKQDNDPYWNFRELLDLERKLGIRSTWFMLPRDVKHTDSYYNLSDKRIKELTLLIREDGHEIALHGTVRSHRSATAMREIREKFSSAFGFKPSGIRQHRLMWEHPQTALIHAETGFIYDSTLGFAQHEGFRNSYCNPFRLYDFEKDEMLPVWEIPLTVMDATLFYYRKLGLQQARENIINIIEEVRRFNGIFNLLWHNSYFDEKDVPGITEFYVNLLNGIKEMNPSINTCSGLVNSMI
ncbi:MAG: polysaccharide deacetylase family protein [Bacteroidales bacterium]